MENHINHPNVFGHTLFADSLMALFPRSRQRNLPGDAWLGETNREAKMNNAMGDPSPCESVARVAIPRRIRAPLTPRGFRESRGCKSSHH
jgi:hypothetical protein